MSIKVKYVHNKQAVPVRGADWKIAFQNDSRFRYQNDVLNKVIFYGGVMNVEREEGMRGNY